jgi:hypothetical protein
VCDFKRLSVGRTSPTTTITLEGSRRPSGESGQASATESREAGPWMFRDRVARHYPTASICRFQACRPRMLMDSPALQQTSMPRQRLRSILKIVFARKSPCNGQKPANSITQARPIIQAVQQLLNSSRTTKSQPFEACCLCGKTIREYRIQARSHDQSECNFKHRGRRTTLPSCAHMDCWA